MRNEACKKNVRKPRVTRGDGRPICCRCKALGLYAVILVSRCRAALVAPPAPAPRHPPHHPGQRCTDDEKHAELSGWPVCPPPPRAPPTGWCEQLGTPKTTVAKPTGLQPYIVPSRLSNVGLVTLWRCPTLANRSMLRRNRRLAHFSALASHVLSDCMTPMALR